MVMASDRVKLLYEGHQILNVIFGILFGSLAILRWYTGRVELEGTAILICLAESSVLVLVCVLPQFIIRRYFVSRNGTGGIGLEAYVWTGAMVLDDYAALLMINIENVIVIMIPAMILVFIGTLGLEQMKSGTVQVSSRPKDHGVNPLTTEKQDNNEEDILSVQKKNTSDKLELFEFVSYLLQLSSVTWTQYKGQQGSTPGLSDILLFLCSALGALGVMLSSSLASVNSREITVQVLPVLHKTCAVLLFIAAHTLAAECLGGDMIYVCLPELIPVILCFTICFGESVSIASFTSVKSQVLIVSSVLAILACLFSWNTNGSNTRGTWIIWSFWISICSSAFSQYHVWLLQGWPGSSSESTKLIPLLKVSSTIYNNVGAMLGAYMIVTDPSIVYEAISSFEHKAMAAVGTIISLFILLVWSARGHPFGHTGNSTEINQAIQRIPEEEP
ncbi:uncharacterized protein LOC123453000 [Hordeum vulgare subsp. vulgare]|uniref:uncharacterized protein LOC123453000 n=1 Tax=Hordeum vulgare subsp. vulgare TaxID=112509 RepID=UPI001D1A397B|nr:uncharacterized protein LOC123453000 [Hordeum vulgare subsp. vulgare]